MRYLILNYFRKYTKLIKKNKIKFISSILISIFLLIILLDSIKFISYDNLKFLYAGIFVYSIAKLFQEIPIINISYQLLEFKIINLNKLKILIILKCIYPTYLIFSILCIIPNMLEYLNFSILILLFIINIITNMISFILNQSKKKNMSKILYLIVITFIYYKNSILLASILFVLILTKIICMKSINYDLLIPYSKALSNISEGLLEGDMNLVSDSQVEFIKSKKNRRVNLIEKFYDRPNLIEFWKEISRALYYENKIINICASNFILSILLLIVNIESKILYLAIFFIMIISVDNILSIINNGEKLNYLIGIYSKYSYKDLIFKKYISHMLIVLVSLLPGFFILKYINTIIFVFIIMILPLRNLSVKFFSKNKLLCTFLNFLFILLFLLSII